MSKLITCWMSGKSKPLAAMSVATSTSLDVSLNLAMASLRSSWSFPPWIDTASTPLSSRYSWMSSTSCFFSQKMSTGGAVFWRHSSKYTILASCFTYSTSWITSRLAAPARPTLTMTGRTSTSRAKSWNFWGMVAEKSSVCRCCLKWETMACTSSSNPKSSMRSASSRHMYRHRSSLIFPWLSRSLRRPGVATTPWTPKRCTGSSCARLSSPPTTRTVLSLG
mmetsp:Transcript_46384/g.104766  ORF Transcript_46384/g.104766 Transcript_46384/m.104766 type:complete len:222 (+) Transcript_46384:599-1264(+)